MEEAMPTRRSARQAPKETEPLSRQAHPGLPGQRWTCHLRLDPVALWLVD